MGKLVWFKVFFTEERVDSKHSLWLIYFLIDKNYVNDNKILQKIFLKVHFSLYDNLYTCDNVLLLLSKKQNKEIENFIKTNKDESEQNEEDQISYSVRGAIKSMVGYI